MEKFINKVLDKCSELFFKYVTDLWIFFIGILGLIVFVFLLTLILGLTSGDFVRAKRVCKLKLKGKNDLALKKLGKIRGGKCFSFDSIVYAPWGYSILKSFARVIVYITTFSFLLMLCIGSSMGSNGFVATIIVCLFGFLLAFIALIIARFNYKRAVKLYFAVKELECGNNGNKCGDKYGNNGNNGNKYGGENHLTGEGNITESENFLDEDLLDSTVALWEKINEASVKRENSREELEILFSLLKEESVKPQTNANRQKLKEARDILSSLIEQY